MPAAAATAAGRAEDRVAAVRAFNRFYTARIGVLRDGLLRTPHSLTEARVLYELGQREVTEVADLRRELDIDAGFLSRLLARLQRDGLVARERSTRRRPPPAHPPHRGGRRGLRRARPPLGRRDRRRPRRARRGRPAAPRRGDGHRPRRARPTPRRPPASSCERPAPATSAGSSSATARSTPQQYGWDESFEALVARIVADYAERPRPAPRGGVDRRGRRRARRLRAVRAPRGRRRPAAPAARRPAGRAGAGSARGWSRSACASPGAPATRASPCGPTTSCTRRAGSTSAPASSSSSPRRTTASATTSSSRPGRGPL